MSEYIVKENNNVLKDHEDHPAGSIIELTKEEAAKIPWAVEPIATPAEDEKPKLPSVKAVVAEVLAIEDPIDRAISAADLLQAENEREDPPTRSTLVSQLEEIIAQAQESASGKENGSKGE